MNDAERSGGIEFAEIHCPYCGEPLEIQVDTSVPEQRYIEDCQVCCRPITLHVVVDPHEGVQVGVRHEDE